MSNSTFDSPASVRDELRDDVQDHLVGDGLHLFVGPVLDRVFDIDRTRDRSQSLRLRVGRIDEFDGRDEDTRDTAIL